MAPAPSKQTVRRSSRNVQSSSSNTNSTLKSKRKALEPSESVTSKKQKPSAVYTSVATVENIKRTKQSTATREKTKTNGGKKSSSTPVSIESKGKEIIEEENGQQDEITGRNHWLLKAEPESRIEKGKDVKFSIDDLQACKIPEPWSGVRNHIAKNNMLSMKKGDLAFFYHSSCKIPGVVGVMEIVQEATPDLSAFDSKDPYYDEKSDPEKPRWFNVHVEFRKKFDNPDITTLTELRKHAENGPLSNMVLVKQSRLSVTKVSSKEWDFILDLAGYTEFKDAPKAD